MEILYQTNLRGVSPDALNGFCAGWRSPLRGSELYQILNGSYRFVLALEDRQVVGFANALSDGLQFAFIPMLEVRPAYQHKGIGTKLMQMLLKELDSITNIDLTCWEHLQPFYERFDMLKTTGVALRKYRNSRTKNNP